MKRLALFFFLFPLLGTAQINAAYVKALYQKYPTQKSDFCPACKLWVNPYYKSIADTVKHAPVVTYYIYTKAHREQQEAANVPRTGIYAAWHPAYGQPDETKVYKAANQQSADMIAKGHCQAWILLAYDADGAILSNTYTFNAAMEYQGQNIGTEIATEELTRKLTLTNDTVKIWCGTWGTFSIPSHYWKVIEYNQTTLAYWMPNLPDEKRSKLPERVIAYNDLVQKLGFDPRAVFQ
ncbi:DNA/RNA non-specific endonuclease [Mucilaginibacter ximonensis]|uniref:DNA/RNA non-specific endonuclease n=1 Tax=Mucilaginibacter ximonensis TaxID=538021 RepID=A0ABW5Y9L0_9SPHI